MWFGNKLFAILETVCEQGGKRSPQFVVIWKAAKFKVNNFYKRTVGFILLTYWLRINPSFWIALRVLGIISTKFSRFAKFECLRYCKKKILFKHTNNNNSNNLGSLSGQSYIERIFILQSVGFDWCRISKLTTLQGGEEDRLSKKRFPSCLHGLNWNNDFFVKCKTLASLIK